MAVGHLPISVKFYWNTAIPICLCIVFGFFRTTMAELSSWDRDYVVHKD